MSFRSVWVGGCADRDPEPCRDRHTPCERGWVPYFVSTVQSCPDSYRTLRTSVVLGRVPDVSRTDDLWSLWSVFLTPKTKGSFWGPVTVSRL